MLKKTMTYTNFNGVEVTEDFYFNLTEAELTMLQYSQHGGYMKHLKTLVDTNDGPAIMAVFRDLIRTAYGEKSDDGRRFVKSKEISDGFEATQAFSDLMMDLFEHPEKSADFIREILPSNLASKVTDEAIDKELGVNVLKLPNA